MEIIKRTDELNAERNWLAHAELWENPFDETLNLRKPSVVQRASPPTIRRSLPGASSRGGRRSARGSAVVHVADGCHEGQHGQAQERGHRRVEQLPLSFRQDRKSTRLNSSH